MLAPTTGRNGPVLGGLPAACERRLLSISEVACRIRIRLRDARHRLLSRQRGLTPLLLVLRQGRQIPWVECEHFANTFCQTWSKQVQGEVTR